MKCHKELCFQTPEQGAFGKENSLSKSLKVVFPKYPFGHLCIWNMDEIGFPCKNISAVFMKNSCVGSIEYANSSVWMQQVEFIKPMIHFIKYTNLSTKSPTLELLDNYVSHLSIEAGDLASQRGVSLLLFSP